MFDSPKNIDFDRSFEGYEDFSISELQLIPKTKKEAVAENTEIFFDGFCKRGHLAIRSVKNGRCLKCISKDKKKFYEANKEDIVKKTVEYLNKRYKEDFSFKAKRIMRFQITRLVSTSKLLKTDSTETIAGYSSEDFKLNMESKFEEGMDWANYGTAWQIDHIKPVALFDVEDVSSIREINALENLVPMFIDKHRSKTISDMVNIIQYKKNKSAAVV